MSILVVAGLGSDVGKTTSVAAIVSVLQQRGRNVVPVKVARLQSTHAAEDVEEIAALTGVRGIDLSAEDDPIARVAELSTIGYTVIVEGSGGVSSPLFDGLTIADVAAKLDAPMVVVSGMAPGAVTLAVQAVRFARACGAYVAGLLGGKLPTNADLRTRLQLIEVSRATGVPFWGSLPEGAAHFDRAAFKRVTSTITLPEDW